MFAQTALLTQILISCKVSKLKLKKVCSIGARRIFIKSKHLKLKRKLLLGSSFSAWLVFYGEQNKTKTMRTNKTGCIWASTCLFSLRLQFQIKYLRCKSVHAYHHRYFNRLAHIPFSWPNTHFPKVKMHFFFHHAKKSFSPPH